MTRSNAAGPSGAISFHTSHGSISAMVLLSASPSSFVNSAGVMLASAAAESVMSNLWGVNPM